MMTAILEFYKCEKCGNIVMVTHTSDGELICCGQLMSLLEEQTADPATQKHVPLVRKTATGIMVTVGSTPHPMEKRHYIQWISVKKDRSFYIHALRPGEAPEAEFPINDPDVKALEFCNVHGLWTNRK